MKPCQHCGRAIEPAALSCSHCGRQQRATVGFDAPEPNCGTRSNAAEADSRSEERQATFVVTLTYVVVLMIAGLMVASGAATTAQAIAIAIILLTPFLALRLLGS